MKFGRILFLGALAASGAAIAQSGDAPPRRNTAIAYKCVNADGSVTYSQDPCSSDPKKVQTVDTSRALRTGSGGSQAEIADSVADSDCRARAYNTTHGESDRIAESNRHIADYRQQRQALESQVSYYGGVDPQTTRSMDELDAAIARESEFQRKEQSSSEQNYQSALKACDDAAQAQATARNTPPAPPPQQQRRKDDSDDGD